jgi:hypothetical protein
MNYNRSFSKECCGFVNELDVCKWTLSDKEMKFNLIAIKHRFHFAEIVNNAHVSLSKNMER